MVCKVNRIKANQGQMKSLNYRDFILNLEFIDKTTKTLDYKDYYELNLDEEIYDKKEIDNKRIKFNYDYNNENYQFQKIRFLFK